MTKIYLETAGCSHNFADSEQMAGLLKQAQFQIVEGLEEADMVIFNTCSVKTPTETAFFKRLKEVEEKHPYKIIVVAGCIAQTEFKKLDKYPLVGVQQVHKIVEVVEEALNDNVIKLLEVGEMPPLNLPRVRKNPLISIIPVSRGCLGACSFCKTKEARGNLASYPLEEIKKEAEQAIKEDVKELWITSQDTGCYGFDINTNLAKLLQELIKIPGEFKIRIGMMSPDHLQRIKEDFFEVFRSPKVFKFIHLPIQSGNNEILKAMKRNYTVEEYTQLVKEIKEHFPWVNLSTDLIVGFPGETEGQHWDTLNVVREIAPDIVNISKFWPRAGTVAAKMKQLPSDTIKHRSKVITDICYNIARMQNERWKGWEGEVIIDEKGKEEGQWIGRNASYKQVVVEGNLKLGQVIKVKIKRTTAHDLRGEVPG